MLLLPVLDSELWFSASTAHADGHRFDFRILVGKKDFLDRLLLDSIAVHIDSVENAFGKIFLFGRGQFGDQEVEEDRSLLPSGVRVGQD